MSRIYIECVIYVDKKILLVNLKWNLYIEKYFLQNLSVI